MFYTNDATGDYFPERYFLDTGEDWEYFETIEQVAKFVSEIVGKNVTPTEKDVNQALEDYMEEHEDDDMYFSFHKFEIVED